MLQNLFVRLALSMLQAIEIFGVWCSIIPGFEMGEIALDVARCTTSSRGAESDIGRHIEWNLMADMKLKVVGVVIVELRIIMEMLG